MQYAPPWAQWRAAVKSGQDATVEQIVHTERPQQTICEDRSRLAIGRAQPMQLQPFSKLANHRHRSRRLEIPWLARPRFKTAIADDRSHSRDPFGYYVAIDSCVRDFDRKMREWSMLARMALLVRQKNLWKHGGYSSWTSWVLIVERDCAEQAMFFVSGTGAEIESVAISAAVVAKNQCPQSRIDNRSA